MEWPTSTDVQRGASNAGLKGMMSVYPTFREIGESMMNKGFTSAIISTIIGFNFGYGKDAYVAAWNKYVSEYRKCKRDSNDPGDFNRADGSTAHRRCLDHASRYITYHYQPSATVYDVSRQGLAPVEYPRQETWGYSEGGGFGGVVSRLSGAALQAVKGANLKGAGPVARSTRRKALPAFVSMPRITPGLLPGAPAPTPAPPAASETEPAKTTGYGWLAIPGALILLSVLR